MMTFRQGVDVSDLGTNMILAIMMCNEIFKVKNGEFSIVAAREAYPTGRAIDIAPHPIKQTNQQIVNLLEMHLGARFKVEYKVGKNIHIEYND